MVKKLSDKEIEDTYNLICEYCEKFLKDEGVKLPGLHYKGGYSKNALALIYLAQNYPDTKTVSKVELTNFIRLYYPETPDSQQGRHLGRQSGWFIASGTRHNSMVELRSGEYKLITLEKPYPYFIPESWGEDIEWEEIKEKYDSRCATCGSKEGEPNLKNPNATTKLQKAHKDPNKPISNENLIPQCGICNRADRNNWVYDEKGRVVKIANPNVVKRSDKNIRWRIYKILYREFNGRNPFNA